MTFIGINIGALTVKVAAIQRALREVPYDFDVMASPGGEFIDPLS